MQVRSQLCLTKFGLIDGQFLFLTARVVPLAVRKNILHLKLKWIYCNPSNFWFNSVSLGFVNVILHSVL
jgi:hypothetical protein